MEPSQVASAVRRIAAKIRASKSPNSKLVAADLKKVIAALEGATPGVTHRIEVPGLMTEFVAAYSDEASPDDLYVDTRVEFMSFASDLGAEVVSADADSLDIVENKPGAVDELMRRCQDASGNLLADPLDFFMSQVGGGKVVTA